MFINNFLNNECPESLIKNKKNSIIIFNIIFNEVQNKIIEDNNFNKVKEENNFERLKLLFISASLALLVLCLTNGIEQYYKLINYLHKK